MKRLIFFVLLFPAMVVTNSQNLVVNPGLEIWTSSTNPASWPTSSKCSSESVNVHSGSMSCMHSGSSTSKGDLGQTIAVTPGKTYSLSLWYMTGVPTTGSGARVWCYWKDIDGTSISDPATDELLRSGDYLSSPTWARFSFTVIAPLNATAFYLEVRTYPNSITYWDDFVFEEGIPTGVQDEPEYDIELYPVPTDDQLVLSNIQGVTKIEIIDFTGTILKSEPASGPNEMIIQVNDLKPSIYLVRLHYGTGTVTRRFVKK